LEVQGFPSNIREVSHPWHPYRRKYPACPYNYKAADPVLHSELNNPAVWYACPYDGDATLVRASYPSSGVSSFSAQRTSKPFDSHRGSDGVELGEAQRTEAF